MTQKVYVVVKGLQSDEVDYNTTEIMAQGDYYFRGGKHFLRYSEYDEEAGVEEKILLKVAGDGSWAEMNRQGLGSTKMMLERGASHNCLYHTPFGQIDLTIITSRLEVTLEENCFLLEGEYRLESGGMFISDNQIRVEARGLEMEQE